MKIRQLAIVLLLLVLAADVAVSQRRADDDRGRSRRDGNDRSESRSRNSEDSGSFNDDYAIITERNIFLRDRSPRDRNDGRTRSTTPATPEQTYVLTGIVFEAGEFHAYLEDVGRGSVQLISPGDPIARGKIGEIQMDSIAYEHEGGRTWVEIGSNLTGNSVSSVSQARITAALGRGSSTATTGPSLPMDPALANLSAEERMRLRRMQELGGGAVVVPQPQQEQPEQVEAIEQPVEQPQQLPVDPNNPNLSVEERMRLRRQQELGR